MVVYVAGYLVCNVTTYVFQSVTRVVSLSFDILYESNTCTPEKPALPEISAMCKMTEHVKTAFRLLSRKASKVPIFP